MSKPSESLDKIITKNDLYGMKPVKEATILDVVKFKRALATALLKCQNKSQVHDAGHVFLILNEKRNIGEG